MTPPERGRAKQMKSVGAATDWRGFAEVMTKNQEIRRGLHDIQNEQCSPPIFWPRSTLVEMNDVLDVIRPNA